MNRNTIEYESAMELIWNFLDILFLLDVVEAEVIDVASEQASWIDYKDETESPLPARGINRWVTY